MWKWIVRILVVVVVLALCGGYFAYRKVQQFTAGGNSATVSIGAPRERVFAALTNTDSMAVWMGSGSTIGSSRHGEVRPGDTLYVRSRSAKGNSSTSLTWTVTNIRPNQLLVMELRSDTSANVLATRRDSLVTAGDSTLIITTVGSPMIEHARMTERDTARSAAAGAMINFGSKIALSAFRVQSEGELNRLKAHIEGKQ